MVEVRIIEKDQMIYDFQICFLILLNLNEVAELLDF